MVEEEEEEEKEEEEDISVHAKHILEVLYDVSGELLLWRRSFFFLDLCFDLVHLSGGR